MKAIFPLLFPRLQFNWRGEHEVTLNLSMYKVHHKMLSTKRNMLMEVFMFDEHTLTVTLTDLVLSEKFSMNMTHNEFLILLSYETPLEKDARVATKKAKEEQIELASTQKSLIMDDELDEEEEAELKRLEDEKSVATANSKSTKVSYHIVSKEKRLRDEKKAQEQLEEKKAAQESNGQNRDTIAALPDNGPRFASEGYAEKVAAAANVDHTDVMAPSDLFNMDLDFSSSTFESTINYELEQIPMKELLTDKSRLARLCVVLREILEPYDKMSPWYAGYICEDPCMLNFLPVVSTEGEAASRLSTNLRHTRQLVHGPRVNSVKGMI